MYGLFVLGAAAIEPLIERDGGGTRQARFRWMAGLVVVCSLATLVNPSAVRIYLPIYDAIRLTQPFL